MRRVVLYLFVVSFVLAQCEAGGPLGAPIAAVMISGMIALKVTVSIFCLFLMNVLYFLSMFIHLCYMNVYIYYLIARKDCICVFVTFLLC